MRRNDLSMSELSSAEFDSTREYTVRKSRLIRLINWWEVSATYLPYMLLLAVGVLIAQVAQESFQNRDAIQETVRTTMSTAAMRELVLDLGWKTTAVLVGVMWWLARRRSPVYLLDFACFEPPAEWRVTHEQLVEIVKRQGCFTDDSVQFMARILERSATGQATAWPPGIIRCLKDAKLPADRSVKAAREESEAVIYKCVADVLEKTGFGLRSSTATYNLSGMGCSAGVIAVDLAKGLLKARPHATALNTLFRCGGAAMILSNKWQDATRAKFKLLHTVRTQGAGKEAYECVYELEDDLGNHGVRLSKDIVKVAGRAMEKNFTSLGPLV
ncbi:unnamed protein product, partial [Phaeothamnion confervicola]